MGQCAYTVVLSQKMGGRGEYCDHVRQLVFFFFKARAKARVPRSVVAERREPHVHNLMVRGVASRIH